MTRSTLAVEPLKWNDDALSRGARLPLARLVQLLLLLQNSHFPNARRLAEACGVSRRTVFRDLAALEAGGIPVAYDPVRQGYEIAGGGLLRSPRLDEREMLAILVLIQSRPLVDPFTLDRDSQTGLAKLLQSLPREVRDRFSALGELFDADPACLAFPEERASSYQTLLFALENRLKLRVWTTEPELGQGLAATLLAAYRMTRGRGAWALVGHSSFHGEVRIFRLPWIARVETTAEAYEIPPRFSLRRFLARMDASLGEQAILRFAPGAADAARDYSLPDGSEFRPAPDGCLDLVLPELAWYQLLGWITDFGTQVEVVEPLALRQRVEAWGLAISNTHAIRLEDAPRAAGPLTRADLRL